MVSETSRSPHSADNAYVEPIYFDPSKHGVVESRGFLFSFQREMYVRNFVRYHKARIRRFHQDRQLDHERKDDMKMSDNLLGALYEAARAANMGGEVQRLATKFNNKR